MTSYEAGETGRYALAVVLTDGRLLGYQRLVVDRGSISPVDVVFRLR